MKHVNKVRAKGRLYFYHRPTGTRLPDDPNTPEFLVRLNELNHQLLVSERSIRPGSFSDLIRCYKASPEFLDLAEKSRRDYLRYLGIIEEAWGSLPVKRLERKHVFKLRDRFSEHRRTANFLVQVLSRILNFGIDRGLRNDNPAARLGRLKTGPGHLPWPEWAIERFRGSAPDELVWAFEVALSTGQREADCLKLLWSHYNGGEIEVTQNKGGERLVIPAAERLKTVLAEVPKRAAVVLTTKTGRPWKADHFRHEFRKALTAAGLNDYTFHGLRKTAAGRLAEAGCTHEEIKAITGHKTDAMVGHYVAGARQKARSRAAIRKLEKKHK